MTTTERLMHICNGGNCLGPASAECKSCSHVSSTLEAPADVRAVAAFTPDGPKNWPEDYPHENGNYECNCVYCDGQFFGHKRRICCKECSGALKLLAPLHEQLRDAPRDFVKQTVAAIASALSAHGTAQRAAGVEAERERQQKEETDAIIRGDYAGPGGPQ